MEHSYNRQSIRNLKGVVDNHAAFNVYLATVLMGKHAPPAHKGQLRYMVLNQPEYVTFCKSLKRFMSFSHIHSFKWHIACFKQGLLRSEHILRYAGDLRKAFSSDYVCEYLDLHNVTFYFAFVDLFVAAYFEAENSP